MNNTPANLQVWFLRHGKPLSLDYNKYDDFMQMLCNGHETPLDVDHEIDFNLLPKRVDLVCYSPYQRAFDTAQVLCKKLAVKRLEKLPSLHEVEFDRDFILEREFKSLEQIRPKVLKRWYKNQNKAESFEDSLARVKEIETFLSQRQEKTIILITHGWFLRILEIYFVQGKRTRTNITLDDILNVTPVPLGHCIKATVARKDYARVGMNLVPV